jgi:hypothetical protein
MCDAFTAMAVLGGASILLQAYGMNKQREASAIAERQAEQNRAASLWAAEVAKADAQYEAMRLEMRADQLAGHVNSAEAAGNVDLSGGHGVRLKSDVRVLSSIDKDMVLLRGAQKARGYILQGDTFSAQASVESLKSDVYMISGLSGMLNTGSYMYATMKPRLDANQPTTPPVPSGNMTVPSSSSLNNGYGVGDWAGEGQV